MGIVVYAMTFSADPVYGPFASRPSQRSRPIYYSDIPEKGKFNHLMYFNYRRSPKWRDAGQ